MPFPEKSQPNIKPVPAICPFCGGTLGEMIPTRINRDLVTNQHRISFALKRQCSKCDEWFVTQDELNYFVRGRKVLTVERIPNYR